MIQYDERSCILKLICKRKGSVFPRALLFGIPSSLLAVLFTRTEVIDAHVRADSGMTELTESMLWSATTASIGLLVSFRIKQALGRFWEGTGLLHQMRGEWFDSVDCLFTFSRQGKALKGIEVVEFRHTLVRLMSLCHGSALEEIKANPQSNYDVIDLRGLDNQTLKYLQESKDVHHFNRVEVLLHMIRVLMTQAIEDQVVMVPPPIASRVYQTLSRGLVNLLNAKKITDTKFPFPFAQLITILLVLYSFLTPLLVSVAIPNSGMAAFISFWPVFASFSLNFAAIELEMPFGDDDNDLPLNDFQAEMNTSLMMLLHEKADIKAGTSGTCDRNFQSLTTNIRRVDESETSVDPGRRKSVVVKKRREASMFDLCNVVEDLPQCPPSSVGNASAGPGQASGDSRPPLFRPLASMEVLLDTGTAMPEEVIARASVDASVAAVPEAPAVDTKVVGIEFALDKSFNQLSAALREWSRRSEAHTEAMSRIILRNTDILASFSDSVPSLADSVPNLAESIPKLVDTISALNDHAPNFANLSAVVSESATKISETMLVFHDLQPRRDQPLVEQKMNTNRMVDTADAMSPAYRDTVWKSVGCCGGPREARLPIHNHHSLATYR